MDYTNLSRVLAQLEQDLLKKPNPLLPINSLQLVEEHGEHYIVWSVGAGGNLGFDKAEECLIAKLQPLGVRLGAGEMRISGSVNSYSLAWEIFAIPVAVIPDFTKEIEHLEKLDGSSQQREATGLANEGRFDLLVSWLCETRYYGNPAKPLRDCGNQSTADRLIALLKSAEPTLRRRAAYALGPLGGEEAGRALCALLPDAKGEELGAIVGALGRLAWSGAVDQLAKALHRTTDNYDRVWLAEALTRCGDEKGYAILIKGLFEDDSWSNEFAGALERLDNPRCISEMKTLLKRTSNRDSRIIAERFLKRHGVLS